MATQQYRSVTTFEMLLRYEKNLKLKNIDGKMAEKDFFRTKTRCHDSTINQLIRATRQDSHGSLRHVPIKPSETLRSLYLEHTLLNNDNLKEES